MDVYSQGAGTPLVAGLAYGTATDYVVLPASDYRLEVRLAGSAATSAPIYSVGPVTLFPQTRVTAIAAGLVASTAAESQFRILPLVEEFEPAADGSARVRVVHLAADAPAVDVDVGDDGSAEIAGLARFGDSGAHGFNLPAAKELEVGIRAGGARVTAFTTQPLNEGSKLFVFAMGLLGKTPREADGFVLMTLDAHGAVRTVRQNPVVYALHASPDAPAVDLFAGPTELVDNLTFGGLSVPVQVRPGSYTVDFYAHTSGALRPSHGAAASAQTPALAAGERYLVSATGFLSPLAGEQPFKLIALADGFASGTTAIRAVHASPDAPRVDVGTAVGTTLTSVLFPNVGFGEASAAEGLLLAPGTAVVGVAGAGSSQTAATFTLAIGQGIRSFVIAAGALSAAADEQAFRLIVVDTATWPWTASSVAAH